MKEYTKDELMVMLEAVVVTRAMHEMALDQGVDYVTFRMDLTNIGCLLCKQYIGNGAEGRCSLCPWQVFEGVQCYDARGELDYDNSKASILRLLRWEGKILGMVAELGGLDKLN